MLTPLALRVISRIRRLNRSRDFGAIMRLMSGPAVKLNPRNFRSCGRATALFASFAVVQAQQYIAQGYGWVIDLDLEKFFDRVNHDKLMA
jgi:retron-type reverse transcriptase